MEESCILVVDDEREIRELLKKYLERELYQVDLASNGEEALCLFQKNNYHLVLLDLMLPKFDGIEVCRRIRNQSNIPILMLTAKDQEFDKVLGLSIGADDYITKPFSINEVMARVKAQIRRFLISGNESLADSTQLIKFKDLTIDLKRYSVFKNEKAISLTAKEFELLKFLASHPEQVFTKNQLFRNVWEHDYLEDDNTVMVHIRKLRMKIETDPSNPLFIQTVWGIGYKFAGEKDEK